VISTGISNFNLYYNTVYLDGSTIRYIGIYHAGSTLTQQTRFEIILFIITRLDQDWQLHFVGRQQICKIMLLVRITIYS
jgi:hypothetical protein